MKKIFTTLFAVLAIAFTYAQVVPNASFEEWTDTHTPAGWNATFDANIPVDFQGMSLNVVINYQAATRNANAHTGSYAAQLSTQTANAQMMGTTLYSINLPGIMHLGEFNVEAFSTLDVGEMTNPDAIDWTQYLTGGIACTQVPEKVTAWVAYNTTEDTLNARVVLTRWNNGQREIVAQGMYESDQVMDDYVQIEIPVTYNEGMENVTPDTLNIIFTNSNGSTNENTLMSVDDVAISAGDNIYEVSTLPLFSVRPNPATEVMILTPFTDESYAVRMYDNSGKLVWAAENLQGETQLNVSEFTKGVYFLQLKQGNNVKSEKVIVK